MTDHEINKALALAIGYMQHHVRQSKHFNGIEVKRPWNLGDFGSWEAFNYRDARVIWPIAELYQVFPSPISDGDEATGKRRGYGNAESWEVSRWNYETDKWEHFHAATAAKAVALAVIGANK